MENIILTKKLTVPSNSGNDTDTTEDSVIITPIGPKKRKNPFARSDENAEEFDEDEQADDLNEAKTYDENEDILEIPSFQNNNSKAIMASPDAKRRQITLSQMVKTSSSTTNQENEINVVKPIQQKMIKPQTNKLATAVTNRLIKMNSFTLGETKSTNKKLNESIEIKPLNNFQFDRNKTKTQINNKTENLRSYFSSSSTSSSSSSSTSKLTRSKVT
jgi:hypothetical protein